MTDGVIATSIRYSAPFIITHPSPPSKNKKKGKQKITPNPQRLFHPPAAQFPTPKTPGREKDPIFTSDRPILVPISPRQELPRLLEQLLHTAHRKGQFLAQTHENLCRHNSFFNKTLRHYENQRTAPYMHKSPKLVCIPVVLYAIL